MMWTPSKAIIRVFWHSGLKLKGMLITAKNSQIEGGKDMNRSEPACKFFLLFFLFLCNCL